MSTEPLAIRYYGNFIFVDYRLIVLERMAASLRHFMRKVRYFDEITALKILLRIVTALKPLRKNKILHRDIKPENLLLNDIEKGEIKIVDFGLALDL